MLLLCLLLLLLQQQQQGLSPLHTPPGSSCCAQLLEHPELLRTPIVRNGRKATVGYCPETWAEWE